MRKEKGSILMMVMPLAAILFISIGMFVYNSAGQNVYNTANEMSENQIQVYNMWMDLYESDELSSTEIKNMITNIINQNNYYEGETGKFISFDVDISGNFDRTSLEDACWDAQIDNSQENLEKVEEELNNVVDSLDSSKTYDVEASYGYNGLITEVKITENN